MYKFILHNKFTNTSEAKITNLFIQKLNFVTLASEVFVNLL